MISEQEKREARLALVLWKAGKGDVFRGDTSGDKVKHRMRKTIIEHELAARIVGHKDDGSKVTFGDAFAETYGEPLNQPIEVAA